MSPEVISQIKDVAVAKPRRRTPPWIKNFGRNEHLRRAVSFLTAMYIRLVYATGRWTHLGEEHPGAFWQENKPFLLAFWHGRILMMPLCWRSEMKMNVLISNHRDGEIIAHAIGQLGMGNIRGSSSKKGADKANDKGGARALRAMVKAIKNGEAVGISPDGPSGPMMRAGDGICTTARLAGVPIIPATFAARHRKVMKSWDRFVVALPFTRGVMMFGEPIFIDRKATPDELEISRARVEQALIDLTREADLVVGAEPVLPPELLTPADSATAPAPEPTVEG